MIITRGREHTINMGNYESVKIHATVAVDTHDPAYSGMPLQHIYDMLDQTLIDAMSKDITEAKVLTNVKDSYILSWRTEV